MVVFLAEIKKTIVELTLKIFFQIKKKKKKLPMHRMKHRGIPSISSILIDSSVKEVKSKKKKKVLEQDVGEGEIREIKDGRDTVVNGGYGTVSRSYGHSPSVHYVNYDKLFSYLGSFRAKGMYEDFNGVDADVRAENSNESTREMVSTETMDKAAKHFKYFMRGEVLGDIGFVPPFGSNISSKEWEKYRLMSQMSIYRPLIRLMMTIA